MFTHFLVPIDGSELSERAAATSIDLARRLGARITGFVAEPMAPMPSMSVNPAVYQRDSEEHNARTQAHAKAVLSRFHQLADAAGVPFDGKFQHADAVDDAIVAAAEEFGCDLVVMVTHGRGAFGELLFGSHTKTVMSRCRKPLLVLH